MVEQEFLSMIMSSRQSCQPDGVPPFLTQDPLYLGKKFFRFIVIGTRYMRLFKRTLHFLVVVIRTKRERSSDVLLDSGIQGEVTCRPCLGQYVWCADQVHPQMCDNECPHLSLRESSSHAQEC